MKTCSQEDVEGHHYPAPHAHRNRGDQPVEPLLCCRSRTPRLADQAPSPAAVLEWCLFERLEAIALALPCRIPGPQVLSGISLHIPKVRDKRFYERNSSLTSLRTSIAISTAISSFRYSYQIIFRANWICREVVVVASIAPAPEIKFPLSSIIVLLLIGGAKLGRLKILKASKRNCTLNVSEILLIGLFLNTDMSMFTIPGPIITFLP